MYKDLTKQRIFDNVNIGFEFEFFSPIARAELAERLTSLLGKNVISTNEYNSDIPVSYTDFKLEPDFSGGFKMNELITGVMPYNEAIHVMYKVMNFIDENGFTTERTGLHINMSLNEFDLGLNERLQNLNVFKYILGLNEEKIFEMWPSAKSRIQKIYKNSVTNIYPKNKFLTETSISYAKPGNPMDFAYPQSKYFGMNFDKLKDGYLEVRYAGGVDYQVKRQSATDLINYVAESLVETLTSNHTYSIDEQRKVTDVIKKQKENSIAIKTYENFAKNFPNIELYIDLKDDPRIIESNYLNLRESLFDLITFGKITKGKVNYDTGTKRVQLKDSILKEGFGIHGLDLINCSIEAEITDCMLFGCKVRSSHVTECRILTDNDIRYCHLDECLFERGGDNRIDLSYIKSSPDSVIYANLNECIVRSGIIALDSKVDNKTEVLSGSAKGSKSPVK
jgi:Putative amidoligase enzyme